jgi:hypothetical protein
MQSVFIKYSADPATIHGVNNWWLLGHEMFGIAFVPVRAKIEDYFLYFYPENYMNSAYPVAPYLL